MHGIKGIKELIQSARDSKHDRSLELEEGRDASLGYFGYLPNEILVYMFSFVKLEELKTSRLVCKSMRTVIDATRTTINKKKKQRFAPIAKKSFGFCQKKALLMFVCCFSFLMVATLIIIGLGSYLIHIIGDRNDLMSAQCLVTDSAVTESSCLTIYTSSNCYYAKWDVVYTLADGRTINSTITGDSSSADDDEDDATSVLDDYHVGSTYQCYYSRTNVLHVEWLRDSYSTPLIITIVAGVTFLIFLVGSIFSCWLWLRRSKSSPPTA